MKKLLKIVRFVVLIGVLSVLFCACHSLSADGNRVQKTLLSRQAEVQTLLAQLKPLLDQHKLDSLLPISPASTDIVFYVYATPDLASS